MDHDQALQQKAAERYLLDELDPAAREMFEEHLFDCPECAFDIRAGVAFVDEAKAQLPELSKPLPIPPRAEPARTKKDRWLTWWRPVFVAPAFAALLLVVGYQNLVTLPGLRAKVDQPQIIPAMALHGATRGNSHPVIAASRKTGLALPLDLDGAAGVARDGSYSFELYGPDKKLVWSRVEAVAEAGDGPISLTLPGAMLRNGTFKLVVNAVGTGGDRAAVETDVFEVRLGD